MGTVSSDNTAFTIGNASLVVASGGSATVTVTYAPTAEAADSGNIIITHNGASSPDTVTASGLGSRAR